LANAFVSPGVNSRGELVPSHGASRRRLGDNYNRIMVKIKQMQYLFYNANKWLQQSLDLKAMVDSNGAANNIIESHFN
jgi:hypothetical protein